MYGNALAITRFAERAGKRYGKGLGLRVLADNKEIARSETLQKLTGKLEPR
jgi:hypothetical protein